MRTFFIFLQVLLTYADDSMPEFECTALEVKSAKAIELLGKRKHSTLSLRKFPSGKWHFTIHQSKTILDESRVSKVVSLDFKSVSYWINYNNLNLKIDLIGTPPSRNGSLYSSEHPPQVSEELSRLTCH